MKEHPSLALEYSPPARGSRNPALTLQPAARPATVEAAVAFPACLNYRLPTALPPPPPRCIRIPISTHCKFGMSFAPSILQNSSASGTSSATSSTRSTAKRTRSVSQTDGERDTASHFYGEFYTPGCAHFYIAVPPIRHGQHYPWHFEDCQHHMGSGRANCSTWHSEIIEHEDFEKFC